MRTAPLIALFLFGACFAACSTDRGRFGRGKDQREDTGSVDVGDAAFPDSGDAGPGSVDVGDAAFPDGGDAGPADGDGSPVTEDDAGIGDDAAGPPLDSGLDCAADGLVECDGLCVDGLTDSNHCGWCGNACSVEQTCRGGFCEAIDTCTPSCVGRACGGDGCGGSCGACATGETCTDGLCVGSCEGIDFETDRRHCGACNDPCADAMVCDGGSCIVSEGGNCFSPDTISSGGTALFTFTGATSESRGSCAASRAELSPARVFTWTPWTTATYRITTIGVGAWADTVMWIYEGSGCTDTETDCDDDGGTDGGSSLEVSATAGTTYTIVVTQYDTTAPLDVTVRLSVSAI